jgi:integrase/recombinase XerC
MRFQEAIRRFDTQLRADGRSEHTCTAYVRDLRQLADSLGWPPVERISVDKIAGHFAARSRVLAPTSLNRTKAATRAFFGFLVRCGVLKDDPSRLLRNGRATRRQPTYLNRSETQRLLRTIDSARDPLALRDQAFFTLLLSTGLRLGSAIALNLSEVDFRNRVIGVLGKGQTHQNVFLPPRASAALAAYIRQSRASNHRDSPVFISGRGSRLTTRQAQFRLKLWLRRAGLRSIGVHALRHTFATRLYEQTRDLRLVQQALGHRSVTSTEIYTHLDLRTLRVAIGAL